MGLEGKIETIREELNNIIESEDKLTKSNIVTVSQELDKLIVEYYNKTDKNQI